MMNCRGNLKLPGVSHTKLRQVRTLRQEELKIENLSASFSNNSAKLQKNSVVLDCNTLLPESKEHVQISDVTLYSDTINSTIAPRTGCKASQVFCTGDGWTLDFTMKNEKEAHDALSSLFYRDVVPNVMVMDGYTAQVEGEFRRKFCDSGWHIKQTEPYTVSSNMGEGGVRELTNGVGRQIICSGCSKRCWDDCIVREVYVCSHTVLDIFGLEGRVPESIVKVEPADISTIAEYEWYTWVNFRGKYASFPVSKIQLGNDLVPAIDTGPAMAQKIMKANGQVMYLTSVNCVSDGEASSFGF
jgi:hypothetical protein